MQLSINESASMTTAAKDQPDTRRERRAEASNKDNPHGHAPHNPQGLPLLMTFARAQRELSCSRRQIYYLIETGGLVAVRIGVRGIRIRSDSVETLARARFEPKAILRLKNQREAAPA
jgi:excisionase family DNA binding protein